MPGIEFVDTERRAGAYTREDPIFSVGARAWVEHNEWGFNRFAQFGKGEMEKVSSVIFLSVKDDNGNCTDRFLLQGLPWLTIGVRQLNLRHRNDLCAASVLDTRFHANGELSRIKVLV